MTDFRRRIYFRYDSNHEHTKRKTHLEVTYTSNNIISNENYTELKKQFRKFLNDEASEDLVEVTSNLKEMFKDFEEKELAVCIDGDNSYQVVEYRDGIMEYGNYSIKDWDDLVSVADSNRSISINYKKNRKRISSKESIEVINEEINYMMNKILELRKMEKKEKWVSEE